MSGVKQQIEAKLTTALSPDHLAVVDESAKHHGHSGWREGGETHFHVEVRSAAFTGKSRLERQRLVYRILAEEMDGPVHALAISARAPGE